LAHLARMAPLTSGRPGLSVDSIAASLMPAASRNAATCFLSYPRRVGRELLATEVI